MENAGAGAGEIASSMLGGRLADVVVVCGPGQNGGDGFVLARHAAIAGHRLRVLYLAASDGRDPPGDAGVNLRICRSMGIPMTPLRGDSDASAHAGAFHTAGLVVDALYGTGLSRPLEGPADLLVRAICAAGRPVLSLDLPSGLDCDSGEPLGTCVRASVTATFAAPKLGFANPTSRAWTGEVRVVGIGAPVSWPLGAEGGAS